MRIISPGLQFTLSLAAGGGGRCLVPFQHLACLSCGLWIVWTVLRGCCAASGLVHFSLVPTAPLTFPVVAALAANPLHFPSPPVFFWSVFFFLSWFPQCPVKPSQASTSQYVDSQVCHTSFEYCIIESESLSTRQTRTVCAPL